MLRRFSILIVLALVSALLVAPTAQGGPENEGELDIQVLPPSPGYIGEEITIFVHDAKPCALRESEVLFSINGAHSITAEVPLDENGNASLSYVGTEVGTDVIRAEVVYSTAPDSHCTRGDFYGAPSISTFEWLNHVEVQGELELSFSVTSPEPHGNTVTVTAVDPEPCEGRSFPEEVTFKVSGANDELVEVPLSEDPNDPDDQGVASFTYEGTNPGIDTITAEIQRWNGPCGTPLTTALEGGETRAQFEWLEQVCQQGETFSLSVTPTTPSPYEIGKDEALFDVESLCNGVATSGAVVEIAVAGATNITDRVTTPAEWAYSSAAVGQDNISFVVPSYEAGETEVVDWDLPTGTYEALTAHEKQAVIAARHPDFTSVSIGEDPGTLFITATAPDLDLPAVQQTIANVYEMPELETLAPVLGLVEYPFAKLLPWYDALSRNAFELGGVTQTYVENETGVIVIGVSEPTKSGEVLELASLLDIPVVAVRVVVAELFEPALLDLHRPMVAGLEIGSPEGTCTLGFNAIRGGVHGFVTNSHCAGLSSMGSVTGTSFRQPAGGGTVGAESVDPPFFSRGKCPKGAVCRFSDSAFVSYSAPGASNHTVGRIAKTALNSNNYTGSERFIIYGKKTPLDNTKIVKTGKVTGRTNGVILDDCVRASVSGTNAILLCQMTASTTSAKGDSGSPVYSSSDSGSDLRILYGLLWGKNPSSTEIVFSPWSNLNKSRELGAMTVCGQEQYTC